MGKIREKFVDVADVVSYGMGQPENLLVWFFLLVIWTSLGPWISKANWLPAWFTSNSWNFPLNTVTTILELFIGFLIAASNNRQERHLFTVLDRIELLEQRILEGEEGRSK